MVDGTLVPRGQGFSLHPRASRELTLALGVIVAFAAVRLAVIVGQPAPLSLDEAQYWIWSRELAWGYFSKPPVLAWLIAASTAVCGDGEACIRFISPLVHALTSLIVFGIGRQLFDVRIGAWSAITYISLPGVSFSAVLASTDVPLLLCWALALYAMARLLRERTAIWWAVLGCAVGVGVLSKYAMLFFPLCAALASLIDVNLRRLLFSRQGGLALMLAMLIALPNVVWNAANNFVSYSHTINNMNLTDDLAHPSEVVEFIGAQFGVFGPILFTFFAAIAWKTLRPSGNAQPHYKLLLVFSLPVLTIISVQAFLSRANANWAATAYVAATILVCAWGVHARKTKWLSASIALHLVVAGVLYNYDALTQTLGITLTRKTDPALQARGWDQAGPWASQLQAQFPGTRFLFEDRRTMAELIYYTQPHPFDAEMWNPGHKRNNHFEMKSRLEASAGKDFIYVTRLKPDAALMASFETAQPADTWRFSAYPGHDITLNAFLLRGFRGYSALSLPSDWKPTP
jgi:4-amino-4-deoxy-L-arabinose transferase-like glycosyltransferase